MTDVTHSPVITDLPGYTAIRTGDGEGIAFAVQVGRGEEERDEPCGYQNGTGPCLTMHRHGTEGVHYRVASRKQNIISISGITRWSDTYHKEYT